MTVKEQNHALENAKAQLESIVNMVYRLEHIETCTDPEGCELTDQEIAEGINIYLRPGETMTAGDREQYHDEDEARERIQEDPLDIQVRSEWHSPGSEENAPDEYMILLTTGGPACRIIGDLGEHSEPASARLEYQDWGTPWTTYPLASHEQERLIEYANNFYFGE